MEISDKNKRKRNASDDGFPTVAIVGATGAVGLELVGCMHARRDVFGNQPPRLFASQRSEGKQIDTKYGTLTVEKYDTEEVIKEVRGTPSRFASCVVRAC